MPDQTNQTRVERELNLTRALLRAEELSQDLNAFTLGLYSKTIIEIRANVGAFASRAESVVQWLRAAEVAEEIHPRATAYAPRDTFEAALMRGLIVRELTAHWTMPGHEYLFELSPTFNAEARGWPLHVTSQKRSTEGIVWLGDALALWYDTYDGARLPVSALASFLYEDESVESEV